MKTSLISKINKPLMVVVLISLFAILATKAYFTASADSSDNVFLSGTINLSINQDEVLSVTDWKPGDEHILEFDVQNTGSLPVQLKGYFEGDWSEPGLDPNMVEIANIEKFVDGTWIQFNNDGLAIDEEFFVSEDGSEDTLTIIDSADSISFRLTAKLAELVTDEYQNQTFTSSLHIAGKQVAQGSDWPTTY